MPLSSLLDSNAYRQSSRFACRRNIFKWLTEENLFKLLNQTDPDIPAEVKFAKDTEIEGVGSVAGGIQEFVDCGYLILDKFKTDDDSSGVYYAWGPRAALEVGRKQVRKREESKFFIDFKAYLTKYLVVADYYLYG